ncbi:hypothetical protein DCAR_0728163 [Daucus carota subsp. sativus]|uniref:Uncharacterized protein n=1 Tax=Daucus carota subsp. sativus TaxID=79200 RepID=A0A175YBB0_DAUCS|nr:hypothetical protein DCAR_0728163 [Daucus carota subsp. sativus]
MKRSRTQDYEILELSEDAMTAYSSNPSALQISPNKNKATTGKQVHGIKDRPRKIAGYHFEGKKKSFDDSHDDANDYGMHRNKISQTIRTHPANTKPTKQTPNSAVITDFRYWNHLPPDLLRLVLNRLNYQERVCLRATCKNWNSILYSATDLIHDIPLRTVALILMKTSSERFKHFFNFLIFWIKDQNDATVRALLNHIPIHQLYQWGHVINRPDESMFTYFMTMAQRLGNLDAEFYWVCKSVVLRNHVCYDVLDISYKIIQDLSTRGHMLSYLFKNMMDIYFFPKKRSDAVTAIAQMITTPTTKPKISGMILALKKIGGHIYPDTIFENLTGPPICNAQLPNEDNHYTPDGYPVHPDQMDEFTCLRCKVALLMGCLSAYLTQSIDLYLDLF